MNKNRAADLKHGSIVQNLFGDKLVIESKHVAFDNGQVREVIISVVDTLLRKVDYVAEDLYELDMLDESDEEKAWVNWATQHRSDIDYIEDIGPVKKAFLSGFSIGYTFKKHYSVEEQLQK